MAAKDDDIDISKLPLTDRLEHKNWKARVSGYEELIKIFAAQDEKSGEFAKYSPFIKKIPVDSNVTAQEKGLAVVSMFVERASPYVSGKVANDVINGCLFKANLSSRAKTKELVSDIVLMYIEIEKHEAVFEELQKCMDNKTPKVVTSAIVVLRESLRQFGSKVVKLTGFGKSITGLLEHKDPNIREEAKQLTIEMYRWFKEAIKPLLQSIKPVLLNELEEEFTKVRDEKPKPLRCLRSEQTHVDNTEEEVQDTGNDNIPSKTPEPEADPYDMYEPVEILSKVPSDFMEKVESKKWQERKEVVESLLKLVTPHPKLMPGDYGEIVKVLKRIISKDANIVVVGVAAKCLAEIAAKLRKSFHPYAHSCVLVVLEKFKEKKQTVVANLREAIDAIMLSSTLEAVLEDVITALDNKNPQIRAETASFIARLCASTNPSSWGNKKVLNPLVEALVKGLNYNDPTVRDASAEALGTIMKVMGEKAMTPYLGDVDSLKLAKIKEYYEKAEVKYTAPVALPQAKSVRSGLPKTSTSRTAGQQPPPPTSSSSSSSSVLSTNVNTNEAGSSLAPPKKIPSKTAPKKVTKPESEVKQPSSSKLKTITKSKSRTGSASALPKGDAQSDDGFTLPLLPINNFKEQRINDEKALKVLKWNFTTPREEFFTLLKEQMITANWNESLVTNCFHSNFKFHLRAIETLNDFLNEGNVEATLCNTDLILKWIALRFFDTNPVVIMKALEYLIKLFQAFRENDQKLSEQEAQSFIPYLIQKTGDPKDAFRQKVHEILEILKDFYSPQRLFSYVLVGLSSKNARQRATCLDELSFLIITYGLSICLPSPADALKAIGKQIGDKDSSVRNAAINCAVAAYQIEGEKVLKLVGAIPDKDMTMLEERIKRKKPLRTASEKTLLKIDDEKKKQENAPFMKKIASESVLKPEISAEKMAKPDCIPRPNMSRVSPPGRSLEDKEKNGTHAPRTLSSALRGQLPQDEEAMYSTPNTTNISRRMYNTGTITKTRPAAFNSPSITSCSPLTGPPESDFNVKRDHDYFIEENFNNHQPRFNRSGTYAMSNGDDLEDEEHRKYKEPEDNTGQFVKSQDIDLSRRIAMTKRTSLSPKQTEFSPGTDRATRITSTLVSQLATDDLYSAFHTGNQLLEVLRQPEKAQVHFSDKVDHIVTRCNLQHKYVLQKHLEDTSIPREDIVDFLKILNLILAAIFEHSTLSKLITRDVLKDLISTVITLLLDVRVSNLPHSPQIIKATNQIATAIINYSDSTNMLSALIKLLQDSLVEKRHSNKPIDLVMKCIWKMCRVIEIVINDLCIDKILFDIHCFFERFPPEYWKNEGPDRDVPMRTIKTVVFLIIKHVEDDIFRHLTMIPDAEETELYVYMQKVLRQARLDRPSSESSRNSLSKRTSVGQSFSELSSHDVIHLMSIIKKLGTSNTDEGFTELHEFCESHPSFNLQNYLNRTQAEFFTSFVMSGLAKTREAFKQGPRLNGSPQKNHNEASEKGPAVNRMSKVNQSYTIVSNNGDRAENLNSHSVPLSNNVENLTPDLIRKWFKAATGQVISDDDAKQYFHQNQQYDFAKRLHEDSKEAKLQVELIKKRSQPYV